MAMNAESTAPAPADVFVVFGITGDLARVMTFRSLYRLEARGLLDCPIVGVAVDDWTLDQLVERARTSIEGTGEPIDEEVFKRFADRLSYVAGDFADPATYGRVGEAIKGAATPVFYLEIPPFLFAKVIKGSPTAGLSKGARFVVEKPFGHDQQSAQRPGRRAAPVRRRVAAVPDRPLPGEDGARGDPAPAVRQRDPRAGLEPQLPRLRPDHDGRELRRRRPRAASTTRSARCATSWSTTSCSSSRPRPWSRRLAATCAPSRSRRSRCSAPSSRPTRPTTSAGSTTGTRTSRASPRARPPRRTPRCGSTSRTGAGPACRSSSAPASGCRSPRPSCAWSSSARPAWASGRRAPPRAQPARHQARPLHRDALPGRRPAYRPRADRADRARHGVRRRGRRGRDAYEVLLHAAMIGRQHPVQPPGRDRGDLAGHAAAARRAAAGPCLRARDLGAGGGQRDHRRAWAAGGRPGCRPERPIDSRTPRPHLRSGVPSMSMQGEEAGSSGARAARVGPRPPVPRRSGRARVRCCLALAPRAALLDRLLGAREPVIGVTAPPGYGKTTLLAAWAERRGARVAWVSCDRIGDDPGSLWPAVMTRPRTRASRRPASRPWPDRSADHVVADPTGRPAARPTPSCSTRSRR